MKYRMVVRDDCLSRSLAESVLAADCVKYGPVRREGCFDVYKITFKGKRSEIEDIIRAHRVAAGRFGVISEGEE